MQLAGLLVSDLLEAVDAKKAIADRARYRSDERRWVRRQIGHAAVGGWVFDVAFAPDGLSFASASQDQTIKLWAVQP